MPLGRDQLFALTRRRALLLALTALVHAELGPRTVLAQTKPANRRVRPPAIIVGRGETGLPPAVADMRGAILAAVETGDIAELRPVMNLSELVPETGAPIGRDPIEHLRGHSTDGTGRDVLDRIGRLIAGTWAAIPGGRDIENNRIYVWPHFAEIALDALTAEERATLADLAGPQQADAMIAARRYRGWRLSIGADGVWHMLTRVGD